MPNVLDVRRRIRSVKNTRQITRAMKMVSAAKLRRAQERALAARPYAQMLTNVLQSLVSRAEVYDPESGEPRHPLLARREERNILLIVVAGEKGLAGAFNANLLKAAQRFLESKQGKNVDVVAIGRKARDFFRRRYSLARHGDHSDRAGAVQITAEHVGILGKLQFADCASIVDDIIAHYTAGQVDAVYLLYNEFKSVISQRLVVDEILPVDEIGAQDIRQVDEMADEARKRAAQVAGTAGVSVREADTTAIDERAAQFGAATVDYIYEQPPAHMFQRLLPKYVAVQVYRAMLESVAAEHAARMTAMDSATNNASEMIDSLTLAMNRARQASITKEIIEIVSGAAAL